MLGCQLKDGTVGAAPSLRPALAALVVLAGAPSLACGPVRPAEAPPVPPELCARGALNRSSLRDLGFPGWANIPADFDMAVTSVDNDVLLGTDDGVWRRSLAGSNLWLPSGLEGHQIRELVPVRGMFGVVLAAGGDFYKPDLPGSFHRSSDGGRSWRTSGWFFDDSRDLPIPMMHLGRQPGIEGGGMGVLYGSVTGDTLVRSTDAGSNWEYARGFGSIDLAIGKCALQVPPWDWNSLYVGCTYGDHAWIGRLDVFDKSGLLESGASLWSRASDQASADDETRIFASSAARPGIVLAAVHPGLMRFDGGVRTWVYPPGYDDRNGSFSEPPGSMNVNIVWIDPCDPRHVVFGGGSLLETFDDFASILPVSEPASGSPLHGVIEGGTAGSGEKDLLLLVTSDYQSRNSSNYRLLLLEHSPPGDKESE
jgi:hypothetical protein